MKKTVTEAGSMIVSAPGPAPASPDFKELVTREVTKLRDSGSISGAVHSRAISMLAHLAPSMYNMFYRQDVDLQQAVAFLLRQARRGM